MLQKLQKKLYNKKGFTLIELIVVIAIIAILAAVLIPRFTGFTQNAHEKAAISDTRNLLVGLEALIAEDTTGIDQGAIETYVGTTFDGTITWATGDEDTDTFEYAIDFGTDTYTVTVEDGTIDPAVDIS